VGGQVLGVGGLLLTARAPCSKREEDGVFYNKLGTPSNIFSCVASRNAQKLGVGAYQIRPLLNGMEWNGHYLPRGVEVLADKRRSFPTCSLDPPT
jgi:hypothetical protein